MFISARSPYCNELPFDEEVLEPRSLAPQLHPIEFSHDDAFNLLEDGFFLEKDNRCETASPEQLTSKKGKARADTDGKIAAVLDKTAENSDSYGKRLRQLRKQTSLNQEEFAKAANLSKSYFSEVEHGKKKLGPSSRNKIAKVLGISADELLAFLSKPQISEVRQVEIKWVRYQPRKT